MRRKEDWEVPYKETKIRVGRKEKVIDSKKIASEMYKTKQNKAKIKKSHIVTLLIVMYTCFIASYIATKSAISKVSSSTEILGIVSYGTRIELDKAWAEYTIDKLGRASGEIRFNLAGGAKVAFDIDPDYIVLHNTNIKEGMYLDVWIETRKRYMGLIKFPKKTQHMDYIINIWEYNEELDKNSGIRHLTGEDTNTEETDRRLEDDMLEVFDRNIEDYKKGN